MKIATEKNSTILIWIGITLLFVGIFFFLYPAKFNINNDVDTSKFSEFGDYFGGVIGAIWSLAGVILFYVALEEQRKDIKINQNALVKQIEEFELQRSELEETRGVIREQSETFKIQRFENTFFQLIHLYNEIIGNLQSSSYSEKFEKRDVINNYSIQLSQSFDSYLKTYKYDDFGGYTEDSQKEIIPNKLEDVENLVFKTYDNFHFNISKQHLSNYFRTTYHVFKFIHKSSLINDEEKQFYANIMRAQLSSDELFLIFYNSLNNGLGFPNFLLLIKKFDILQNFDFGLIEKHKFHKELYYKRLEEINNFTL